jgi:hypothetical protein
MKNFLFLLLFISVSLQGIAQTTPVDAQQNINSLSRGGITRTFNNTYKGVKGTVFIYPKWSEGIIYSWKKAYNYTEIQYDGYNDEVLFRHKNQEIIAEKSVVDSFEIKLEESTRYFTRVNSSEDNKSMFMEVLYNGPNKLLAQRKKKLLKANLSSNYGTTREYDEFTDETNYFLMKGNAIIKMKSGKKFFLRNFPEKKDLESYIKSKKIDFKDEEDLKKLFAFIHSN